MVDLYLEGGVGVSRGGRRDVGDRSVDVSGVSKV